MKITLNELKRLFSTESDGDFCIEILFSLSEQKDFKECWMGKSTNFKKPYWFGLSPDSKSKYDFESFDQMLKAPVFDDKCLQEVAEAINIIEIDGCEPEQRLLYYTESENKL